MTIGAIIVCIVMTFAIIGSVVYIIVGCDSVKATVISILIALLLTASIWGGTFWYYNNTASGRRDLVDERAELANGLERTINIYTANGDLIATYTGKIDLEDNDGGYVLFDWNGKRYTYYNCFVESIADIE